mmetsp:Transcript_19258/g.27448  ORF Transcript_19258/g.27448 Transcript_19258/m.27448 type:complete len:373 (+) Transcript_19258:72-1190(+)
MRLPQEIVLKVLHSRFATTAATSRSARKCISSSSGIISHQKMKEYSEDAAKNDVVDVEELHRLAVLRGEFTYTDPSTGFMVFTELAHLNRGKCCGNKCRHCPFGYVNVPVKQSARTNNKSDKSNVVLGTGKGGKFGGTLTKKNVPYTRTGDQGTAALFTGERRIKNDLVFEAMGTVDELCSFVGRAHAELVTPNTQGQDGTLVSYGPLPEWLLEIMSRLFDAGSIIAKPTSKKQTKDEHESLSSDESTSSDESATSDKGNFDTEHVTNLEKWIDLMTEELPPLGSFILPTGSRSAADLHVCRTVCRRAERLVVGLSTQGVCDTEILRYINRLSDFFFTAARYANEVEKREEILYKRHSPDSKQRYRVVIKKT